MKVTLLLADAAQAVGGKLYVLGGGWSIIGPDPAPTALAIKIDVPWDEANARHLLEVRLEKLDGQPVLVPTPMGDQPLKIESQFEVGRPPGIKPGTALDMAIAVAIAPIPLDPGEGYVWVLSIDGRSEDTWRAPFSVRQRDAQPPAAQA